MTAHRQGPLRRVEAVLVRASDAFSRQKVKLECGREVYASANAGTRARCWKCKAPKSPGANSTQENLNMSTVRELVELAAEAVGIQGAWQEFVNEPGAFIGRYAQPRDGVTGYYWKPHTDDGDSMRLATDLGMSLKRTRLASANRTAAIAAEIPRDDHHPRDISELVEIADDAGAATRMAVLRAAAAVAQWRRSPADQGEAGAQTDDAAGAGSALVRFLPDGWSIQHAEDGEILVSAPDGNGMHVADRGALAVRLLHAMAGALLETEVPALSEQQRELMARRIVGDDPVSLTTARRIIDETVRACVPAAATAAEAQEA